MDSEKLKQFIVPIALLILIIVGICFVTPKIINNVNSYSAAKNTNVAKMATIQEKETKLKALQEKAAAEAKQEEEKANSGKPFYKPVMKGLDTEAVIAGEFTEILQLIRANKIKVRSIKYDYDPKDDEFVKNAGANYNVARLNMEMVANYGNYDNFLKELYKHEHFLDIQSAEIVPYKKNKRVLLINFKVKLYAKK